MKKMSGALALIALFGFGFMSPLAFAEDKDKDKDKGNVVNMVIYGDDEKKDEGGK